MGNFSLVGIWFSNLGFSAEVLLKDTHGQCAGGCLGLLIHEISSGAGLSSVAKPRNFPWGGHYEWKKNTSWSGYRNFRKPLNVSAEFPLSLLLLWHLHFNNIRRRPYITLSWNRDVGNSILAAYQSSSCFRPWKCVSKNILKTVDLAIRGTIGHLPWQLIGHTSKHWTR